ncbi:hypothetical protein CJJ23_01665 [Mycoplasmopsis agassizii]|uniref:Uncharacterized protein n=1 Tax=Mycoplasmopsis agassizii TaxID=33922 RepID=A0A269TJ94_9BACT|nr:hypothetical protein [Mycoplasmopsis agassizii]PAK21481.1 hypothetical protein CJJ23_01665 [Mycoplasmopsis agassizii]
MFSVLIWLILGFTFLIYLVPLGALFITKGLITNVNNRIMNLLKTNKIPFITGYVTGKYSHQLLRNVIIGEWFLIIFFSFIPFVFISVAYSININILYIKMKQNINITIEKVVFGLTGFFTIIYWLLMSLVVKRNKKLRLINLNVSTNQFRKSELKNLYLEMNAIQDNYDDLNVYYKIIVWWDKRIIKKLETENTLNNKYNLYIFSVNHIATNIKFYPPEKGEISDARFLNSYAKKVFNTIFEKEIMIWKPTEK